MQQLLPGQQLPPGTFDPNMPPGMQQMMPGPGGPQIFPPPNVGMEFNHPDQFAVPGQPPSGWDGGRYNNSDSDYNSSDGENRRHSSRRREASRHRRHRDRSDKDRDRSKAVTEIVQVLGEKKVLHDLRALERNTRVPPAQFVARVKL